MHNMSNLCLTDNPFLEKCLRVFFHKQQPHSVLFEALAGAALLGVQQLAIERPFDV